MAVVVFTSATGAPGTTTLALGLALTWPRNVVLADCDPEPAQAIQAGFLRGTDAGGRGLNALARLHRERQPLEPAILAQVVPLTADDAIHRQFLPGFGQPAAVRLFDPVWPELAAAFASLEDPGTDVLVDAGRIGRDGLPTPLLDVADAVVVVSRSSLRSLASLRLYLPVLSEQIQRLPREVPTGLAVIDPHSPYSPSEIGAHFGLPNWASIPKHDAMAAVLSDGADQPRKFADSSLMNAYGTFASRLFERVQLERQQQSAVVARRQHV